MSADLCSDAWHQTTAAPDLAALTKKAEWAALKCCTCILGGEGIHFSGCRTLDVLAALRASQTAREQAEQRAARAEAALRGLLETGKRDLSNPKYDGYFDAARDALRATTVAR